MSWLRWQAQGELRGKRPVVLRGCGHCSRAFRLGPWQGRSASDLDFSSGCGSSRHCGRRLLHLEGEVHYEAVMGNVNDYCCSPKGEPVHPAQGNALGKRRTTMFFCVDARWAQRANRSRCNGANHWPVGPTNENVLEPPYPGRCPGLGEPGAFGPTIVGYWGTS